MIRLIGLIGLIGSGDALAQAPSDPTSAYVALLERYAAGEVDEAARAMLAIEVKPAREIAELAVSNIESDMRALARLDRNTNITIPREVFMNNLRRKRLRTLKLALLVHTEAGLRTAAPQGQLLIAADLVNRLWELRKDFLRNGPLEPSSGEAMAAGSDAQWDGVRLFIRDWYLLVVSQFATLGQLPSLRLHIAAGLSRLEGDPELLLARGSLHEQDADASVVDRSLLTRVYTPAFIAQRRRQLLYARDDYARASRATPALAEARLRWARVQGLLGETSAAIEAVTAVAASDAPSFVRYLAQLFAGELHEQRHDENAARAAYEAALAQWPHSNAPKLALSRLAMASGDTVTARQWLARSFAEAKSPALAANISGVLPPCGIILL